MQSRQNIFLLLTFLYFGNKWLFFSWNVLGALTQQETSHQCKSPSLPSGLRWPARVQRWREMPTRGKGGLAWSCKLFYLCAFRIAPYFPTIFVSASFHPWEWDSHVKGFPRAACQGTQAREAFCIEASLLTQSVFDLLPPAPSTCCKCHPSDHEALLPLSALPAFSP